MNTTPEHAYFIRLRRTLVERALGEEITWTAASVGIALIAVLLIRLGVRRQGARRD